MADNVLTVGLILIYAANAPILGAQGDMKGGVLSLLFALVSYLIFWR